MKNKRAPVISLTIFFLILLSTGLSGYYVWQGFLHGFDKYLPILASTLLLDGLGVFALVFKVSFETRRRAMVPFICSIALLCCCAIHLAALARSKFVLLSPYLARSRSLLLSLLLARSLSLLLSVSLAHAHYIYCARIEKLNGGAFTLKTQRL